MNMGESQKVSKINWNVVIVVGFLILFLFLLLLWINNSTSKCEGLDRYDDRLNRCYFPIEQNTTSCSGIIKPFAVNNVTTTEACLYKKVGYFNGSRIRSWFFWLLVLVGGGIIIFIFYRYFESRNFTFGLGAKDPIWPSEARKLIEARFAKDHGGYCYTDEGGDERAGSDFKWLPDYQRNFPVISDDWHYRSAFEVHFGDSPGIYTVNVDLTKGKKWVSEMANIVRDHPLNADFQGKDMPFSRPKTAEDRAIEVAERLGHDSHEVRQQAINYTLSQSGFGQGQRDNDDTEIDAGKRGQRR